MSRKNRLFIYGYNGFRNVGADCRIMPIVEHLKRLVPDAELVVNTFHRHNLDFLEGATVDYFHPTTYPFAAKRRIESADAAILCEGNMLTDEFTPHMVQAFTIAMRQGAAAGVPTIGLALDSGVLSPKREPRVIEALNTLSLLTARSAGAAEVLRSRGVTAPIETTADCAVNMRLPSEGRRQQVLDRLGMLGGPVYGIAPVDFPMFPARIAPIGRREDFVRWPFKGTWPDDGRRHSAALLREWTSYAHHLLSMHPRAKVAVIAMDPSDTQFARRLWRSIGRPERTLLVVGRDHDPLDVSALLGGLRTLTSSRYHGVVLSLPYAVPYIALGHDTRTLFLSQELDVEEFFVEHTTPTLQADLRDRHEALVASDDDVRARIRRGFHAMQERDLDNYRHIGRVLERVGYAVEPVASAAGV